MSTVDEKKRRGLRIFFTALVMITVTFAAGVMYLKGYGENQSVFLTDITRVAQPSVATNTNLSNATISEPAPSPMVFILPYTLEASTTQYWFHHWGALSVVNGGFLLSATTTNVGGSVFLDHAASWTDYTVEANIEWLTGGWLDIAARVTNNTKNFVYCAFGSNTLGIIRRVDYNDVFIANGAMPAGVVSPTNLGMSVYGNDVGCLVNGKEVLGATVARDESTSGGIGFIAWGEKAKDQLAVKSVSVVPLTENTIVVPFSVSVVASATSTVGTPAVSAQTGSTPAITVPLAPAEASEPSIPVAAPAHAIATTTKSLPLFLDTFDKSQGWQGWSGNFEVATDSLTIGASSAGTSGGILLSGTQAFGNYTFQATLDWVQGETFGLVARYTNNKNYVACEFDEVALGDVQINLEQYINGDEYTIVQGDVNGWDQWGGSNIVAAIQVQNSQGTCSFNGHIISTAGTGNTINPPFSGRIGFTTWDSDKNNSEIVVKQVSVDPLQQL